MLPALKTLTLPCLLALGFAIPNTPPDTKPAGAKKADSKEDPASVAEELADELAGIARAYQPFFDDPWLRFGKASFGLAQKDAKLMVVDGKIDSARVYDFHNQLDEFTRAIGYFPSWVPGTTGWGDLRGQQQPQKKDVKKVVDDIAKVRARANGVEGFKEVSLVVLRDDVTPAEAAEYGQFVVQRVEFLLYARGLCSITGGGRQQTDEQVGPSLKKMRDALSQLGTESEETDPAKKSAELAAKIAAVKTAVEEFEADTTVLCKILDVVRPRVEIATKDLDRMLKNLEHLKTPRK